MILFGREIRNKETFSADSNEEMHDSSRLYPSSDELNEDSGKQTCVYVFGFLLASPVAAETTTGDEKQSKIIRPCRVVDMGVLWGEEIIISAVSSPFSSSSSMLDFLFFEGGRRVAVGFGDAISTALTQSSGVGKTIAYCTAEDEI